MAIGGVSVGEQNCLTLGFLGSEINFLKALVHQLALRSSTLLVHLNIFSLQRCVFRHSISCAFCTLN